MYRYFTFVDIDFAKIYEHICVFQYFFVPLQANNKYSLIIIH